MKITQIKETCLYIKDLKKSREFYVDKLGLQLISEKEGRHIFFRAGASVLLCFIPESTVREKELPPHAASGQIHFAFEVSQAEYGNTKKTILEKNIEIIHEQNWGNELKSFYFRDPDGHLVEIVPEGLWGK